MTRATNQNRGISSKPRPKVKRSTKCCTVCAIDKPLSDFKNDVSQEDGVFYTCKECEVKSQRITDGKHVIEKLEKLEASTITAIDLMSRSDRKVPHMDELLEELMYVFGGTEGISRHYIMNFMAAAPGSAVRERMLSQILNLTVKATQEGMATLDEDSLNDEDMERELKQRILRLTRTQSDGHSGQVAG